jgi:hypothetical protein
MDSLAIAAWAAFRHFNCFVDEVVSLVGPLEEAAPSGLGARTRQASRNHGLHRLTATELNPASSSLLNSLSDFGIVRGRRNPESLHLVKQRGALKTEYCSCSAWATQLPVCSLTCSENLLANFVL